VPLFQTSRSVTFVLPGTELWVFALCWQLQVAAEGEACANALAAVAVAWMSGVVLHARMT
jgi:hypothetical protein